MTRLMNVLALCTFLTVGCRASATLECAPSSTPYWDYSGSESGPDNWGDLPGFELCETGMEQSPIEIIASQTIPETGDLRPVLDLELPRATRFINTGRTLQLEFARGEGMVIGGTRYELLNVHFHAPAEHVIDGKTYAMEAHVVTLDRNSQTPSAAVLGVFLDVEQAAANPLLATVLDGFPEARPGQNCVVTPNVPVDLELARDGLPDSTGLWTYEGSLTTPSCGEFVRFFLYNEPMPVSQAQVEQFKRVVGQPVTARPVQPLNGRQVTTLP